jgi:ribonuclease HII
MQMPSLAEEMKLRAQGYQLIAGIDEVGRGALAGPVVAAAVILPFPSDIHWLNQVKDSKKLSAARRQILFGCIGEIAVAVGVGTVCHEVIDGRGILKATRLAMKSAVDKLLPAPESLLIDYICLPEVPLPQKGITNGDELCLSIACASIVAKVTRDRLMVEYDSIYPGYGLANHKGYGTRTHLTNLHRLGPSPIHRRSFQPIKGMI